MSGEASPKQSNIICKKCGIHLTPGKVTFEYMGNVFPTDLDKCSQCGLVYIPESLVTGKMLQVEKMLEDK